MTAFHGSYVKPWSCWCTAEETLTLWPPAARAAVTRAPRSASQQVPESLQKLTTPHITRAQHFRGRHQVLWPTHPNLLTRPRSRGQAPWGPTLLRSDFTLQGRVTYPVVGLAFIWRGCGLSLRVDRNGSTCFYLYCPPWAVLDTPEFTGRHWKKKPEECLDMAIIPQLCAWH